MRLRKSPEERQARRIDNAVRVQAGGLVDSTLKRYLEQEVAPPYRFNAGPAPEGISQDKFSQRVGELATRELREYFGDELPVAYDEARSKSATNEFPAIQPDTQIPTTPDDVIVVFSPRQELPQPHLRIAS